MFRDSWHDKCSYCGKEFQVFKGSTKYCSNECAAAARKQKRIEYNKASYQNRKAKEVNFNAIEKPN